MAQALVCCTSHFGRGEGDETGQAEDLEPGECA